MTSCVLDTDVVIGALDRADVHHLAAKRTVAGMVEAERPVLLSTINYAEALVRPAQEGRTLRAALAAIDALGIKLIAPTALVAREAARLRALNLSLAAGFALATAQAHRASLATFDGRVRRSLPAAGVPLAAGLQ